jgi:hypothetical protein
MCTLSKYYRGDEVKQNEMGAFRYLVGTPEEKRDRLEDLRVDAMVI